MTTTHLALHGQVRESAREETQALQADELVRVRLRIALALLGVEAVALGGVASVGWGVYRLFFQ